VTWQDAFDRWIASTPGTVESVFYCREAERLLDDELDRIRALARELRELAKEEP
jgi:hypothetical protein